MWIWRARRDAVEIGYGNNLHILPDIALINGQSVFTLYTSRLEIANLGAAV
jgi:hypothetical protein